MPRGRMHEAGEFADVGATVNAWLGGRAPGKGIPGRRSSSGRERRSGGLTRLDDPALVAGEYADDTRLRRRAAAFTGATTERDVRVSVVEAVAESNPARVLEVGCGWGELAEWIGRDTGADVVATDLSPHMVSLACDRGVDAHIADVQDLPFEDGEFDVAVAAWMLYHVPDLDRGVAELARVLRSGGRLVAVTNSRFHLLELRELVGSGPSTAEVLA